MLSPQATEPQQELSTGKRMKLDAFFALYKNINSKWILGPNVRGQTIKLERKHGKETLLPCSRQSLRHENFKMQVTKKKVGTNLN